MTASVVAFSAISAQGRGTAAVDVGSEGERATCHVSEDGALRDAGVRRPYVARAEIEGDGDRAQLLLSYTNGQLEAALCSLGICVSPERTRIIVGTSSGGMFSTVRAVDALDSGGSVSPALAQAASYYGPLVSLKAQPRLAGVPTMQILSACASSTIALGLGLRALQLGDADVVIAGGYDAVSPFVAAGFDALGATTERPRPFRVDRDGLALGEGAAWLVLTQPGIGPCIGTLEGFGMASDAYHVTQPHPDGRGLGAAAKRALSDAQRESVDLVSGHGTGTPLNDEREARAILAACQSAPHVHGFKGVVGHTLGAAGALESLAALFAMQRGLLPATTGPGEVIDLLARRVLDENRAGDVRSCLKLSAAFGGANAALIWSRDEGSRVAPRQPLAVFLRGEPIGITEADVTSHARLKVPLETLQRFDPISRLAIAAALEICDAQGAALPGGAAVILGTSSATLEINAAFERKRRRRGAEPRRFPPTSPNLAPCAVSIALGLSGPAFAVGGSDAAGAEAAVVAADLIAAGDAPAALVISLEYPGPFVAALRQARGLEPPAAGAVACLLSRQGAGVGISRAALQRAWTAQAGQSSPGPAGLEAALAAAGS